MDPELFENLRMELRRGFLVLAVLGQLQNEQYGYTLRKSLLERGMQIDEGTLYPLLRRLETQGLLVSEWREEAKRKKRFYRISAEGSAVFAELLNEWRRLDSSLEQIAATNDNRLKEGNLHESTGKISGGLKTPVTA